MSMNFKLINLKLVVFLMLFGTFWCFIVLFGAFWCFFVLVKSCHKKKKFKTDLITSFILLLFLCRETLLLKKKMETYPRYNFFMEANALHRTLKKTKSMCFPLLFKLWFCRPVAKKRNYNRNPVEHLRWRFFFFAKTPHRKC